MINQNWTKAVQNFVLQEDCIRAKTNACRIWLKCAKVRANYMLATLSADHTKLYRVEFL